MASSSHTGMQKPQGHYDFSRDELENSMGYYQDDSRILLQQEMADAYRPQWQMYPQAVIQHNFDLRTHQHAMPPWQHQAYSMGFHQQDQLQHQLTHPPRGVRPGPPLEPMQQRPAYLEKKASLGIESLPIPRSPHQISAGVSPIPYHTGIHSKPSVEPINPETFFSENISNSVPEDYPTSLPADFAQGIRNSRIPCRCCVANQDARTLCTYCRGNGDIELHAKLVTLRDSIQNNLQLARKQLQNRISSSAWYSNNYKHKQGVFIAPAAKVLADRTTEAQVAQKVLDGQAVCRTGEESDTLVPTRVNSRGSAGSTQPTHTSTKGSGEVATNPLSPDAVKPSDHLQKPDRWDELAELTKKVGDVQSSVQRLNHDLSRTLPEAPHNTNNSFEDDGKVKVKNLIVNEGFVGHGRDDQMDFQDDYEAEDYGEEEHIEVSCEEDDDHHNDMYALAAQVKFHKGGELKTIQRKMDRGLKGNGAKRDKTDRSKSKQSGNSSFSTLKKGKSFSAQDRKKEIELQSMKQEKKLAVKAGLIGDSSTFYDALVEQRPPAPILVNQNELDASKLCKSIATSQMASLQIPMMSQTKKICEGCDIRLETRPEYYTCKQCGDYWLCKDCHENGTSQHDNSHNFIEERNEHKRASMRVRQSTELPSQVLESRSLATKVVTYDVRIEGEVQNLSQEFCVLLRFSNLSDEPFPSDTSLKGVDSIQNIDVKLGALEPKQCNPYKIIISKKNAHSIKNKFLFQFEVGSKARPEKKFSGISLTISHDGDKFKGEVSLRDRVHKESSGLNFIGCTIFEKFFKGGCHRITA